VLQQATSLATALTHRGGTTIGVYAVGGDGTPSAGGVVITGDCEDSGDPNATTVKSETLRCPPDASDDACGSCIKRSCCAEAIAWYDGSNANGTEVVACVDAHCAAACPVAP
jgi:hypothetical protein